MAIEKMSLINLVGNMVDLDKTLAQCLKSGYFHPELALHSTEDTHGFHILEVDNPYATPLNRLLQLASELHLKLDTDGAGAESHTLAQATDYLSQLEQDVGVLINRKREIKGNISQHEQAIVQIKHLAGLNVSFDNIFACQYVKVRFGRLPCSSYSKLAYYDNKTFFFFPFDNDKEYYWGVYFAPATNIGVIDDIFTSLYFERMRVPDYAHGTPEMATANINTVLTGEREELAEIRKKLEDVQKSAAKELRSIYDALKFSATAFDLRKYVATVNNRFYMVGFIPATHKDEFSVLFDEIVSVDYVVKPCDADPSLSPPIKLKNNRFAKPFEQFVEMYSLPSHRDIDPTSFFAITYTLMFGIMFGDLGQGIVVAISGIVLWRWKKMNLGKIIARLGISSAIFGTLYGSVFGFEDLLDPFFHSLGIKFLPLKVFDANTTNYILLSTLAIGMVLITISICTNICLGFRCKDYLRAVFSQNGIAGLVFYLSTIFLVTDMMMFHTGVCNVVYVLLLIVLPLLVIMFQEPLSRLAAGHKKPFEDGIGEFFMVCFFELFEYLLSYLSNTMSFLRIAGFILSHAGMMMVVMLLGNMAGVVSPLVLVVGNLFVMGLEGLIVGIQVLRLEFYEIFSRNFEGNGKPFEPAQVIYGSDQ